MGPNLPCDGRIDQRHQVANLTATANGTAARLRARSRVRSQPRVYLHTLARTPGCGNDRNRRRTRREENLPAFGERPVSRESLRRRGDTGVVGTLFLKQRLDIDRIRVARRDTVLFALPASHKETPESLERSLGRMFLRTLGLELCETCRNTVV